MTNQMIDFPISNFSNSGMENIHVYTRWKPRSLAEHLGTGRQYNINSKRGRLHLLFAEDELVAGVGDQGLPVAQIIGPLILPADGLQLVPLPLRQAQGFLHQRCV